MAYGVVTGSHTEQLMQQSHSTLISAMWSEIASFWPAAFVPNQQEGLHRSDTDNNYAFITDAPYAEYVTTRKPCQLYKTSNFLDRQFYAFAVNKNDDRFLSRINEQIYHMHANGEVEDLRQKWWKSECERKRDTKTVDSNSRESNTNMPRPSENTPGDSPYHESNNASRHVLNIAILVAATYIIMKVRS